MLHVQLAAVIGFSSLTCSPASIPPSMVSTTSPTLPAITTRVGYCGAVFTDYLNYGEAHYYSLGLSSYETVTVSNCGTYDMYYLDTTLFVLDSNMQDISSAGYCNGGGDDCGDCGLNEQFSMPLAPGEYFVKIAPLSSYSSGYYQLNIYCGTAPPMPSGDSSNVGYGVNDISCNGPSID